MNIRGREEENDVAGFEQIVINAVPLLDIMADAICILDRHKKIIYSNAAYEKMLSRASSEPVADSRPIICDGVWCGQIVVFHDASEVNRLKQELDCVNRKLRKVQGKYSFKDIIGADEAMVKIINRARIAAMTPATMMLRGESGTGKEIFANAIHNASPRRNERFIKINCSAIPEELLESELFGYKGGAFTGAVKGGRKGLFQEADKGTLFLDEIGDISPKMQVKLLRVLQEREVTPVGSAETIPVDVRIICATNKPLEKMVEAGEFREDLYYRLNVFPLNIPPLRERKEDIGLIAIHILNKHRDFYEHNITDIDDNAMKLLKERTWHGNVRELENVLLRAVINADSKTTVLNEQDIKGALLDEKQSDGNTKLKNAENTKDEKSSMKLNDVVALAEKECIENALKLTRGDKNEAAYHLGIPLRTLYYKCKKYGI